RALGRADPWRSRQGLAGGALPHHPRHARHAGRQGSSPAALQIRRQAAEVGGEKEMSRRRAAVKRQVLPDPKFGDNVRTKVMNCLMYEGKKSVAERILYGAFDRIQKRTGQDPIRVFHDALTNVRPAVEVRSRRVGGATYQVPVEVRTDRSQALAIRWLISSS